MPNSNPRAGRRAMIRQSPCDLRSASTSPNSSNASLILTPSRCASTNQMTLESSTSLKAIITDPLSAEMSSSAESCPEPFDDEACFVDLQQNQVDFITLLPSEIATYILSLLPHHNDVLSCSLVSKSWNNLCYDWQIWLRQFQNRTKDGWRLIEGLDDIWRAILKNADQREIDHPDKSQSIGSGDLEPQSSRRRRGVRVDEDPLHSNFASRIADISMDSVDLDLTRVSIQSDAEYTDGIDWFAIYRARYFLTKRWSLDDNDPKPAVLESSSGTISYSLANRQESFSINEQDEIRLITPEQSSLRNNTFEPVDKHLLGHTDSVYCVRFDNRSFQLPAEMTRSLTQDHRNGPLYDSRTSLGLGSFGKILSGSRDRSIRIWDGDSGICLYTLKGHDGSVLCLEYDDDFLFSASSDRTCIVWDLKVIERGFTPIAIERLRGHTAGILDLAINKDWLITCSKDTTVRVYDRTKDCKLIHIYSQHCGPINAGTLSHNPIDGKTRAVSASGEGGVHLWDVESGTLIRSFVGHAKGLACVKYLDDLIVTGSNDTTVRLWDAETGACLCVCKGHGDLVRSVGFDPKRKIILSGGYDGKVKLFYVGRELHQDAILPSDGNVGYAFMSINAGHEARVFDVQMDATRILCCGEDNKVCVRDFGRGFPLMRLFS